MWNPNTLPNAFLRRSALLITGLALIACSGSGDSESDQTTVPTTGATGPAETFPFRFDDLGGGSPVIQVYPGTSTAEADRTYNGTFLHGDRVSAVCKQIGRVVNSDPSVGEAEASSDIWVQLADTPQIMFATSVYADLDPKTLNVMPDC